MDKQLFHPRINAVTDDLNSKQLIALLNWLWVNKFTVTPANIKGWRKRNLN